MKLLPFGGSYGRFPPRKRNYTAPKARYSTRQEQAKLLLQELRIWLDKALAQAPPKTAIGNVLHYLHQAFTDAAMDISQLTEENRKLIDLA